MGHNRTRSGSTRGGRADRRGTRARSRTIQQLGGENGQRVPAAAVDRGDGPEQRDADNVDSAPSRPPRRGGDQLSFDREGFPAVRYTEAERELQPRGTRTLLFRRRIFLSWGILLCRSLFGTPPVYLTPATRLVGSSLAALARAPGAPAGPGAQVPPAPVRIPSAWSWNASRARFDRRKLDYVIPVGNVTDFTTTNLGPSHVRGARDQQRGDQSPNSPSRPSRANGSNLAMLLSSRSRRSCRSLGLGRGDLGPAGGHRGSRDLFCRRSVSRPGRS